VVQIDMCAVYAAAECCRVEPDVSDGDSRHTQGWPTKLWRPGLAAIAA
jgi:hypothetical protein